MEFAYRYDNDTIQKFNYYDLLSRTVLQNSLIIGVEVKHTKRTPIKIIKGDICGNKVEVKITSDGLYIV